MNDDTDKLLKELDALTEKDGWRSLKELEDAGRRLPDTLKELEELYGNGSAALDEILAEMAKKGFF